VVEYGKFNKETTCLWIEQREATCSSILPAFGSEVISRSLSISLNSLNLPAAAALNNIGTSIEAATVCYQTVLLEKCIYFIYLVLCIGSFH
jgi:hypothetical protein